MRTTINAAIISAKRLLLVQKSWTWILPGGKPEADEQDEDCLRRKVAEELSGTELENLSYYGEFDVMTPHTRDTLVAKVYFADINGDLGIPSREIRYRRWFRADDGHDLSDITSKVIESLRGEGYL